MPLLSNLVYVALATAPPGGGYTRDQLQLLATTALQEFSRMEARCSVPASPTQPDFEAEAIYRRSADLMELFVAHENYPQNRQGYINRSDDIAAVVQGLERAYMCHPGWEQRYYLDRAVALIEVRLEQIRVGEQRALNEPDGEILQQALVRLRTLERTVTPPPACNAPTCPRPSVTKEPEPQAEPIGGYRGKYVDLLSLRIELGGGINTQMLDQTSAEQGSKTPATGARHISSVVLFSLAPGVRFLVGRHQRHVLATGFRWTVLSFKQPDVGGDISDAAHQMVARFEYGVRLHKRWFSIHAAFEPGIQAHSSVTAFGRGQVGGSGMLCTGNESFCVRFGGYSGSLGREPGLDGMSLGAGLDVFRVVDNLLRRAEQ